MSHSRRLILLLIALPALVGICDAQIGLDIDNISVTVDGKTAHLSRAQLAALPHVVVTVHGSSGSEQFEGVPLSCLLGNFGIKVDTELHGPPPSGVLVVEAANGEKVTFSLREIASSRSGIVLADRQDGKNLSVREWPRIVVPGDKQMDRWLPQVAKLGIAASK